MIEQKTDQISSGYLYSTTTTTESQRQLARYRGWRIRVLGVLEHSGGLTIREIAEKLNHRKVDVKEYCRRLLKDGDIERVERWGYKITTSGLHILNINYGNTKATVRQQLGNTKATEYKQLTLKPWQSDRTEHEVVVVEYLLKHFKETGSKWMWKFEIDPEKIEVPPSDLNKAILKLLSSKIIYKYRDRDTKLLKYGLTDFFLEGYQYI